MTARTRFGAFLALLLATSGSDHRAAQRQSEQAPAALADPVAVDYQPGADEMLVSVASGFESVSAEGIRTRFGRLPNWPAGAAVAVSKDDSDVFAADEIFTARRIGQIVKLNAAGELQGDPWASLPGEKGLVTALHVDRTGAFGGDLIAGTAGGNIWRIDGEAKPAFVAATGLPIVALLAVPDVDRYGLWAGQLIAATGSPMCRLLVVSPSGEMTEVDAHLCISDLDLVVPDADLFVAGTRDGVAAGAGFLFRTTADELGSYACDMIGSDRAGALVILTPGSAEITTRRFTFEGYSLRGLALASAANACQPEICGDMVDNNGDGEVEEGCREVCDAVDNDGDGEIDENCREVCGDGEDNDKNGAIDDSCVEICGDGIDNDSDDLIDAPCPEICKDTIDNDRNGRVDENCPLPPVAAGCGPERWLRRPGAWMGLEPDQLAGTVFSLNDALAPLGLMSMRAALSPLRGDSATAAEGALLRAAIAALLNGANASVGYPLSSQHVLSQVNDALESRRRERTDALASVLDALNQLRCPLPTQEERPIREGSP
jgi:hypothetical protein